VLLLPVYVWGAFRILEAAADGDPFVLVILFGVLILGFFFLAVPVALVSTRIAAATAIAVIALALVLAPGKNGDSPNPSPEPVAPQEPRLSKDELLQEQNIEKLCTEQYPGIEGLDDRSRCVRENTPTLP